MTNFSYFLLNPKTKTTNLKTLIFISLSLACSQQALAQNCVIHLETNSTEKFTFTYYQDAYDIVDSHQTFASPIDTIDHVQEFQLNLYGPREINLEKKGRRILWNFLVLPGDTILIREKNGQLAFSGNFQAQYEYLQKIKGMSLGYFLLHSSKWKKETDKFVASISKLKNQQYQQLNNTIKNGKLRSVFIDYAKQKIEADYIADFFRFASFSSKANTEYYTDSVISNTLAKYNWSNPSFQATLPFNYMVREFSFGVNYLKMEEKRMEGQSISFNESYQERLDLCKQFLPKIAQNMGSYTVVFEYIDVYKYAKGLNNYDSLVTANDSFANTMILGINEPTGQNILQEKWAALRPKNLPVEKAEIWGINATGSKVDISQFKGKIVYVDFWGMGCAPCRHAMPFAAKLQEKYKNDEIVFVYLSVDNSFEKMDSFLKSKGVNGVHLLTDPENEVQQRYQVRSIPRYMLIDRDGNFIAKDTLGPEHETIENIIDEVLKTEKKIE